MSQWYYVSSGKQVGPFDEEIIKNKLSSGEIRNDTNVWQEGMSDWLPANQTLLSQYFSTVSIPPPIDHPQLQLFFPTSTTKLVVMSICTFGIYQLYWFYKNWQFIKESQGLKIRPFWRAIFIFIFCHSLFKTVRDYAKDNNVHAEYSPEWLTFGFIFISIMWKLPDPVGIVSSFAVLTLLPVQGAINAINTKVSPNVRINDKFKGWNIAGIILGVILWALVFIGMAMPE